MNSIKRQDLPCGLWVVATPIGNMGDLGERAKEALLAAEFVVCEDTRRTAKLMAVIGDPHPLARLERLDAHATEGRIARVVEKLVTGASVALVTDAGTPGISDPGAVLVAAARTAGVRITPIPGPSAVATLLSVSGIRESAFTFRGFFPRKKKDMSRELADIQKCGVSRVFVWFESPERIQESLGFIGETFPDAQCFAGKELSKVHEKFFSGSAREVSEQVAQEVRSQGVLGEWCFVLNLREERTEGEGGENGDGEQPQQSSEWVKALHCLLDCRISASEAAQQVSRRFEIPKRSVYELALKILGKK